MTIRYSFIKSEIKIFPGRYLKNYDYLRLRNIHTPSESTKQKMLHCTSFIHKKATLNENSRSRVKGEQPKQISKLHLRLGMEK